MSRSFGPRPKHRKRRRLDSAVAVGFAIVGCLATDATYAVVRGWPGGNSGLRQIQAGTAGSWSVRYVTGSAPVTDSAGAVWAPAPITAISGGSEVGLRKPEHTGSPLLYANARVGITRWTVPVVGPGRYAIDLLLTDPHRAVSSQPVMSVRALGGAQPQTLAQNVNIDKQAGIDQPNHITGVVRVVGTVLTLSFSASHGQTTASALRVTKLSPAGSGHGFSLPFNGPAGAPAPKSVFTHTVGPHWDAGAETYTGSRQNSDLDGHGDLVITAKSTGSTYTSAMLTTNRKLSFGYGTISARMRLPSGRGLWPAFWAKGTDESTIGWPACGEIDMMEEFGRAPRTVAGHVHTDATRSTHDPRYAATHSYVSTSGRNWNTGSKIVGWHVYSITYEPDQITFRFDGKPYFTATPEDLRPGESWPFNRPHNYILLDLAVGGPFAGHPAASDFPARLLISRVWATTN